MLGLLLLLFYGLVIAVVLSAVLIVRRLRNPPRRTYASAVARRMPGDPGELPPPLGPREFRAFAFQAPQIGSATSGSRGAPHSRVAIDLPAWEIPGDNPKGPTIICTPGWGDSKIGVLTRLGALLPRASSVIAWDPSGLGESPDWSRCHLGTDADVEALAALVRACVGDSGPGGSPRPFILFGWSMGAGISIVAATRLARGGLAPAAVIAEAPYRHARTPVVNYLRASRLPYRVAGPLVMGYLGLRLRRSLDWSTFDRATFAADLSCPLLVIHGALDAVCPIDDGRAIAAASTQSLLVTIENAGHNDLWSLDRFAEQSTAAVNDFVRALA